MPSWSVSDRPARWRPLVRSPAGRRRHFVLVELLFAVRGDDGARAVGAIDDDDDADVGFAGRRRVVPAPARQRATGSSTTIGQILQH